MYGEAERAVGFELSGSILRLVPPVETGKRTNGITMTQRIRIAQEHYIQYGWLDGRFLVKEVIIDRRGIDVSRWIDANDWSVATFKKWLGY